MQSNTFQIKIKMDVPNSVIEYLKLQQIWENEGGALKKRDHTLQEYNLCIPLSSGNSFRVVCGYMDLEADSLYYIAKLISLDHVVQT